MHYDVFISYSRKDYEDAQGKIIPGNPVSAIKEALKKSGISYWIDKEGIYHGETFDDKIIKSISQTDILVFLSSKNSNKSLYTPKEIAWAVKSGKYIIPVLIDSTGFNSKLAFWFSDINYLLYYANPQKGLDDLVNSIKSHLQAIRDDKGLIDEIKAECELLNTEESSIEQKRDDLLTLSMSIIDEDQRAKIQSFIKESSPIRIKYIKEKQRDQESDVPVSVPFLLKQKIWFQNVVSKVKSSLLGFKHSLSQILSKIGAGLGNGKKALNNVWSFFSNLFSIIVTKIIGAFKTLSLKSLLWTLVILAVGFLSYYGWSHRSSILPIFDGNVAVEDTVDEPEVKPYQYGIDLLMDSVRNIIDTMEIEDPQFVEYYQGFLNNDSSSTYRLGKWFEGKDSNAKGLTLAAKLVRRAAEEGYADAQITLGFYYYYHKEGIPRNYSEAVQWFERAEEQGSIYAKYYLGYAYKYGGYKGTKTSVQLYEKAIPYFEESASHGYARSMYELGLYSWNNERNYSKALMYFKSAYDAHIQNANNITKRLQAPEPGDCAYLIYECYKKGKGTEPEPYEAEKWLKIAANEGNKKAISELSRK